MTTDLYDVQHRYVADHRDDPAWPGRTPEPTVVETVAGVRVPVARSWAANAQPVHHELAAKMLRVLPGRRLMGIVGHGDQSSSWMAMNDGPDGHGSWLIPYDCDEATRAVRAATDAPSWRDPMTDADLALARAWAEAAEPYPVKRGFLTLLDEIDRLRERVAELELEVESSWTPAGVEPRT